MARTKDPNNGRLEEALVALIQNQASFLGRISEMDRINSERFGRIETILIDHSRILADQGRILADHSRALAELARLVQALPETVREKIGFKG